MRKHFIKIISIFIICSLVILPIKAWDDLGLWDDWDDWDEYSFWLDEVVVYGDYDDNYDWGLDDDWWRSDYWDNDYGWDDYDDFDDWWDDYYDYYIPDNSENSDSPIDVDREFPTSKEPAPQEGCSLWCIKQVFEALGVTYTSDKMIEAAAKILGTTPEVLATLLEYRGLSDSEINKLYDAFFNYTYTQDQSDLRKALDDGKYVVGIIEMGGFGNVEKGHDVVLIDYEKNSNGSYTYTYYDPATNSVQTGNSEDFYNDGYIVNGIK